jgi:hypothetical protein
MKSIRRLLLPVLTISLTSCGSIMGSQWWERVVGVIDYGGFQAQPPIQLPEVIRSGEPFTATVVTWGSGTCTRADGAEVAVVEGGVEITPYDREKRGDGVICTDDLRAYPRTVTVRIETTGEAVIRVKGRTLHPSDPAVYETRVTVLHD